MIVRIKDYNSNTGPDTKQVECKNVLEVVIVVSALHQILHKHFTHYSFNTTTILQVGMYILETSIEDDIDTDVCLISKPMAFLLLHVCAKIILSLARVAQ